MLTVLQIIEKSAEYLKKYEVESPRLNAELLLADILKCKRFDLYLNYDRPLSENEINKMREYLKRRANREPLQYIINKAYFYKYEFYVNSKVLIPRPETEILVEYTINSLGKNFNGNILDVGVGSGNISICLANDLPDSKIFGIDISTDALDAARINSQKLLKENNLYLYILDILNSKEIIEFVEKNCPDKFDAIVANPPYVSIDEYANLQKEITDFEPKIAVTDNGDGLNFYRSIAENSQTLIKRGGKIFCEIGKDQSESIAEIFQNYKIKTLKIIEDYQKIPRIIIGEKE